MMIWKEANDRNWQFTRIGLNERTFLEVIAVCPKDRQTGLTYMEVSFVVRMGSFSLIDYVRHNDVPDLITDRRNQALRAAVEWVDGLRGLLDLGKVEIDKLLPPV